MPVDLSEFPGLPPILVSPPWPDEAFVRELASELRQRALWKPRRAAPDPQYSTDLACMMAPVPEFMQQAVMMLFRAGVMAYGLEVNAVDQPFLLLYPEGIGHRPHKDWSPNSVDGSNLRTISMTWMLSDGFTGGALCSTYGKHEAGFGQAVLFTAETEHWVEPVESGERLVLIAFGKRIDGA